MMKAQAKFLIVAAVAHLTLAAKEDAPVEVDQSDADSLPIDLDSQSFFTEVADRESHFVKETGKDWFVEFYSPYCGHCKHLAPIWDEYHQRNKDTLNIARIDCTDNKGYDICSDFGIRGYPTLLYMPEGQNKSYKYSGMRSVEGFESWVANKKWQSEQGTEIATSKSFLESIMPSAEDIQSMIDKFLQ